MEGRVEGGVALILGTELPRGLDSFSLILLSSQLYASIKDSEHMHTHLSDTPTVRRFKVLYSV